MDYWNVSDVGSLFDVVAFWPFVNVLLTVHLSVIPAINQHDAQNLLS